ncbi:unnamed protein product [Ranitomeya imitator]|uniref:Uncharacterized protein n=1 Tax=Ranitomeya imitator TaxID=111125 RepID=A0ABN9LC50_9NEOB|nr:unnamed protein product [Ranitomeya imitator]
MANSVEGFKRGLDVFLEQNIDIVPVYQIKGISKLVKLCLPKVQCFCDSLTSPPSERQAPKEEKENWMRKGATHEEGRVNVMDFKPCLPRSMFPMVVQWAHGPTHRSKTHMNDLIGTY